MGDIMKSILTTTTQIFLDLVRLIFNGYKDHIKSLRKQYIIKVYRTPKEDECIKQYGNIPNIPRAFFSDEDNAE